MEEPSEHALTAKVVQFGKYRTIHVKSAELILNFALGPRPLV